MPLKLLNLSQIKLILFVTIFLVVFHNLTFIQQVASTYSDADAVWLTLLSVTIIHACVVTILFSVIGFSKLLKPLLIIVLLVSSFTAYYIDTYHVVIDTVMIGNVMDTDTAEVFDLLDIRLLAYFLLIGVLPAYLVYKVTLVEESIPRVVLKRMVLILACIVVAGSTLYVSSDFYASFFRTNKILRFYTNPVTPIYSVSKYFADKFKQNKHKEFKSIALDSKKPKSDGDAELVVLVVGETARADHFSLNGYHRETNPLLAQEDVISFTNVASCGTSTAVSLPCMFSVEERDNYDKAKADNMDNVLDILKRSGVYILWRENNTGDKGVANRIEYESYKKPDINPVCDAECRDEGMLNDLDKWVEQHKGEDMLIILHQMGSHGPAYFKRYPAEFEVFQPTCKTSRLEDCKTEELINAYDNTILYTDYFLSRVIGWLKSKPSSYETSMFYISDHGESLGEAGVYLHGFPYAFAPTTQKHVPAILWVGHENPDIDLKSVRSNSNVALSHDNLFHTLLGLFEIKSDIYDSKKDILTYTKTYD
jgi:lipid A ethanolaminephosphotransferase